MKKFQTYRLALIEGDFFPQTPNPHSYFSSLFTHFSLLSWVSDQYNIIIHDQIQHQVKQKQVKVYEFTQKDKSEPSYLVEFNKDPILNQISYCIYDNKDRIMEKLHQLQASIKVIISKHNQTSKLTKKQRTVIFIDIQDYHNYFKKFKGDQKNRSSFCFNSINRLKSNQICYYYKEPLSIKNKIIKKCHFNLAFQGGGAKGVSYVGVYKALKDMHRNVPVKSVIGSSAGGILALAISSEMDPEDIKTLCLKMDTIPKDKLFKQQSQITPQIQMQFDGLIQKVKSLLHNYGILEHTLFDQLMQSLSDIQTGQKILKALYHIHPSVAQLFTLRIQPCVVKKSFFSSEKQTYTRRFNYYGLLMAGLMKGEAVQDIAAESIINFIQKHYEVHQKQSEAIKCEIRLPKIRKILQKWKYSEEQARQGWIFTSQKFKSSVKTLTLKEFYSMNEIQFTCTSVDLDDQILRFFNHKTTPDLPVCKMVQMSGSFPIAFQAQRWKSNWGKYYIHYDNVRKQIDLTDHQFTDGGLLANFPIKYLDNQLMRPMYFSHKKSNQHSILYGFGLDQVEDREVVNKQAQQQKKQAFKELKEHILSKISKWKLLKNLIFSDSSKELQKVDFTELPIFEYLVKLLKTFKVADYNLNIECFDRSVIQMQVENKMLQNTKEVEVELLKFNKFDKLLQQLQTLSSSKAHLDPFELLNFSLEKCIIKLNQYENIQNRVVYDIRDNILQNLYTYQGLRLKNNLKCLPFLSKIMYKLQLICQQKTFNMQQSFSAKRRLISCIEILRNDFVKLKDIKSKDLEFMYNKIISDQKSTIHRIRERLKEIALVLNQKENETSKCDDGKAYIECGEYHNNTFIDYEVVFDLISMERRFFLADKDYITTIMNEIKSLNLPIISIEKQIFDNLPKIQEDISRMILNSTSNKLHIMLEAKENSHLYYCGLFSILHDKLNQEENKAKSIEMITCSDIHSIFAFLYAGGKKINTIRQEMWKVSNLITLEKDIDKQYKQMKWAQTKGQQVAELVNLTWKQHFDLFSQIQKHLQDSGKTDLKVEIQKIKNEFIYSKSTAVNGMEKILNYVVEAAQTVKSIKDINQRKEMFAKLVSVRHQLNGKDFRKQNTNISKNTQRFIQKIMFHFEELVSYILLNNELIKDTFETIDDSHKNEVWKGALIKKLLSTKKLQTYIKDKLKNMNLNPNTTLGQFYKFSTRKITLNFLLINKGQERLEIVNQYTKPNMPLWAAIIASTSLPWILPEFMSKEQWEVNNFVDSRMRKLFDYFFNGQEIKKQNVYISGNYTSTLPLQLLTNERIAIENYVNLKTYEQVYIKTNQQGQSTGSSFNNNSQVRESANFSYITFSFIKSNRNIQKSYQFQTKNKQFFTFSNVINLGIDALMGHYKNISIGLRDIIRRTEIFKFLSTRIECHDNTIMYYYYDQTIKLPIRLGTLDFHKIQEQKVEILMDCVYEAEFVVRGIFDNLSVSKDLEEYSYLSKKKVYLQYETYQDQIYLNFISKSKWNKKLSTMFRIFFKEIETENFIEYVDKPIILSKDIVQVRFKFIYPDMNNLKQQQQQYLINFQHLKEEFSDIKEKNLIFKFDFEKISSRVIQGTELNHKKLKTRVIPSSKPNIQDRSMNDQSSSSGLYIVKPLKNMSIKAKSHTNNVITIRSIISLKNNGLYCKQCVFKLSRTLKKEQIRSSNDFDKCSKCKHNSNLIGYECQRADCIGKDSNRYCFPCIMIHLIKKIKGKYVCSIENHEFRFENLWNSQALGLCYFCCCASNEYFRDDACDINICLKCSWILDSKTFSLS